MPTQPITQSVVGSASLELLHQGSPKQLLDALCSEALEHSAVDHPYLQRLADGDLPNVQAAIRDLCHQYYFYATEFTSALNAVIRGLELKSHRELVQQNMDEEMGVDPANEQEVSHVQLFQRFRRAAGVTAEYELNNPPCRAVLHWRDEFLQLCRTQPVGVGIGAMGIGTEGIVATVYGFLHQAVSKHTDMTAADYLFLTVHEECDDEHADQMIQIGLDLAADPAQREALRMGVFSALALRNDFWDAMLARALAL